MYNSYCVQVGLSIMKLNAIIALAIINCSVHGMVSQNEYTQIAMKHSYDLERQLVPFVKEMNDVFVPKIHYTDGLDGFLFSNKLLTYRVPATKAADVEEADAYELSMALASKKMRSLVRSMGFDPANLNVQAQLPYTYPDVVAAAISHRAVSVLVKMLASKTNSYACALTTGTHAAYACASVSAATKKRLADTLAAYYLAPSSFPITSSAFALLQHPALVTRLAADIAAIDESMKEFHRVAHYNQLVETSSQSASNLSSGVDSDSEDASDDEVAYQDDVLLTQDWLSDNKV